MSETKTDNQAVLESLRHSVAKALECKRRLGHYAVVSKNGQIVHVAPEEIKPLAAAEEEASYNQRHTDI